MSDLGRQKQEENRAMMQSDDLAIRKLILRAIADDYEEFNRVVQDVKGWAAERGIATRRPSRRAPGKPGPSDVVL